jgi:hypothetical protein
MTTSFVEVVAASQGLLPPPCSRCLWWQTAAGTVTGLDRRLAWMSNLERTWGSVGIVAVEGEETVASVQFAPARALPRAYLLGGCPVPEEAVLLFCLRGRLSSSALHPRQVLHQAMAHLRRRGVGDAYAFARPLGNESTCGVRNLCGLEFLQANGFEVVGGDGQVFLTRVELRGLLPSLSMAGQLWRRLRGPSAAPSPVAFKSR